MRVLHVNTFAEGGGAERIAATLHRETMALGQTSRFAVGKGRITAENVFDFNELYPRGGWYGLHRSLYRFAKANTFKGCTRLSRFAELLMVPQRTRDHFAGREIFDYPATQALVDWAADNADIVHCHNLHGEYFDLRALPGLTGRMPVVLTLHDEWTYTGHCAYTFDCQRWRTGCGACPSLHIPPSVMKDATAENWRAKRAIWSQGRIFLATPSRWLMEKAHQSILSPSIVDSRVIANGVDLDTYRTGDKAAARAELDLPQDAVILLFVANGLHNPLKDFRTLMRSLQCVVDNDKLEQGKLVLVALGAQGALDADDSGRELPCIRAPFQKDPARVALYYQAADVYIHAARSDNFPTTILEAMATGLPVVASRVGGIPEQVADGESGILVPPEDPASMAAAIERIVVDSELRTRFGERSAALAKAKFGQRTMTQNYLDWYREILDGVRTPQTLGAGR